MTTISIVRGGSVDTVTALRVLGDYALVELGSCYGITRLVTGARIWMSIAGQSDLAHAVLEELQQVPPWHLQTRRLVRADVRAADRLAQALLVLAPVAKVVK